MPNCDFYGTIDDHAAILEWLFDEGTCEVYELYSAYDALLKRFASGSEVLAEFDQVHENGVKWDAVHLQLRVLGASPPLAPRRITLDQRRCRGATFRYVADGCGLVQLYLKTPSKHGLDNSHTNHGSVARVQAFSFLQEEPPDLNAWDFKKINSFSARLNRQIKKRGVAKRGSRPVLPGALALWQSGVPFFPLNTGDVTVTHRGELKSY